MLLIITTQVKMMLPHELATMFIFFSGILIGMGLLFGIIAAIVFYFEV
jgi:hypothetical protein